MTTTRKPAPKSKGRMVAQLAAPDDPDKADAMAKLATRPSINAAAVMVSYTGPLGEQDVGALADCLAEGMEGVWAGDLKRAEAMLYGQAHALQAMFMNFARRASAQEYMKNMEAFTRMALKAQNQCRMTLETLALLKNPPVVIAKQANINHGGQQQVNNGAGPGHGVDSTPARAFTGASAHAANSTSDQTELLEASDGQRLDTRAASKTGRANPNMAPVGKVHRAAHR